MRKIRNRITLALLLFTAIFAVGMTTVSLTNSIQLIRAESHEKLMNLANSYARQMDGALLGMETTAHAFTGYIESTFDLQQAKQDPAYINRYIHTHQDFFLQYTNDLRGYGYFINPSLTSEPANFIISNSDNDGTALILPREQADIYTSSPDYKVIRHTFETGTSNWEGPVVSAIFEDLEWFVYTEPAYVDYMAVATVVVAYPYREMQTLINDLKVYGEGYGVLMDEEMKYVIHPVLDIGIDLREVRDGAYAGIADRMADQPEGIVTYDWLNGEEKSLAYSRLSNGWTLAITANQADIDAGVRTHVINMIGMIVVGLVFVLIVGYLLSWELTRPLEGLTQKILAIGCGDYDTPLPKKFIEDTSEIGTLAAAVEDMRMRQKYSFDKLTEYTENLEEQVNDRTHALLDANTELRASMDELAKTQDMLVKSKSFQAVNAMLIEMAHRMNTPLGNAITTSSYVESQLEHMNKDIQSGKLKKQTALDDLSDMLHAIRMTQMNLQASSEIISSLRKISEDENISRPQRLEMNEYIGEAMAYIHALVKDEGDFTATIDCTDEVSMIGYPKMIIEVLNHLVLFSLRNGKRVSDKVKIGISASVKGQNIELTYADNCQYTYEGKVEHIFDPFTFAAFDQGIVGLELNLAYNLAQTGLSGQLSCDRDSPDHLIFTLLMPRFPDSDV